MNYRMIGFVVGRILLTEAALLALPVVTALLYGESPVPFLAAALALVAAGLALGIRKPERRYYRIPRRYPPSSILCVLVVARMIYYER